MGVPVSITPDILDFGGVAPGSGPNINVDPSLGPPAISFAGGVQIKDVPADATVTFSVDGPNATNFRVRDVTVMEWEIEPVDNGELPPGHHGPPPMVAVLEIVDQSTGASPVSVVKGQFLLVRVEYTAPAAEGKFTATLSIRGSTWDSRDVVLSFFVAQVQTQFADTPVTLFRGNKQTIGMMITALFGPDGVPVSYKNSPLQLDSGITIESKGNHPYRAFRSPTGLQFLIVDIASDSPLGDNNLSIDQFDPYTRTGLLLPVKVISAP